ncbi:MAG: 50S ribosomal protein L29 [Anaerolineae bacterium]|nr:50S ribosomal protein L29 [Anaerolineae bacterium]
MRPSELRQMSAGELLTELDNLKKERFNLRFQQTSGQVENTGRLREIRRDVARIMTILGEMNVEGENAK